MNKKTYQRPETENIAFPDLPEHLLKGTTDEVFARQYVLYEEDEDEEEEERLFQIRFKNLWEEE